ncbi:MAG: hypothetical protein K2O45_05290 [Oscillospiraceae bacterium]|nr:hypothetical protein [Oscillospiraceae bacterium]
MVQEGNTITIGGIGSTTGTTFKFKVSATSTLSGTDVIDVSNVKGSAAQIKEAIAQLTNKTVNNFTISAGTGNKLHVDYTGNSTAAYPTYEEAQKMITAKTGSTSTTKTYNAAEITVKDNDAIASGNTLTFGTGSNAVKIAFTTASDASAKNTDKVKYVTIASTASKTAKAIADSIGSLATASGNKVIYRSASVDDAAPALSSKNLTLQIGDTSDSYNQLGVAVGDMHTDAMGIAGIDIGNQEGAQAAIQTIRNAINYVSSVRGDLGATQNRLEHTANNLSVMAENIQDAESTIRDTDVAEEMMSYVKNNILVQSAQAMLAQANQVPQGVLQLLG